MPVVCLKASHFGLDGSETLSALEGMQDLVALKEKIRLAAGSLMNLGDVSDKTVPKMSFLSPARKGGDISSLTFIPHKVHEAIGVLGAVSVATACCVSGTVAHDISPATGEGDGPVQIDVEHPTGFFSLELEYSFEDDQAVIHRSALLRTARKLMTGEVYVPSSIWGQS